MSINAILIQPAFIMWPINLYTLSRLFYTIQNRFVSRQDSDLTLTSTVLYKGRSRSWAYPLISSEALYLISTSRREKQMKKEIIKLVVVIGLTANIASLVILDTL